MKLSSIQTFHSERNAGRIRTWARRKVEKVSHKIWWRLKRSYRLAAGGHQLHRKVDFLICGAQKAGTSALASYLDEHPEICLADAKELHFFDNEDLFQSVFSDYAMYHCAFNPKPSHKLLGEATPIYMYWYTAPRRMWEYNPNLKLIVILRNPITRAYSHWNMQRSRGIEPLSFWEAIQREKERCREALPYQHRLYSYVDRGFYSEQLRRLWFYFPTDRVLVLRTEELRKSPLESLEKVCGFLGIGSPGKVLPREVHSRPYLSPMQEKEKNYLLDIYEYEIRHLERILGWDCADWLNL